MPYNILCSYIVLLFNLLKQIDKLLSILSINPKIVRPYMVFLWTIRACFPLSMIYSNYPCKLRVCPYSICKE